MSHNVANMRKSPICASSLWRLDITWSWFVGCNIVVKDYLVMDYLVMIDWFLAISITSRKKTYSSLSNSWFTNHYPSRLPKKKNNNYVLLSRYPQRESKTHIQTLQTSALLQTALTFTDGTMRLWVSPSAGWRPPWYPRRAARWAPHSPARRSPRWSQASAGARRCGPWRARRSVWNHLRIHSIGPWWAKLVHTLQSKCDKGICLGKGPRNGGYGKRTSRNGGFSVAVFDHQRGTEDFSDFLWWEKAEGIDKSWATTGREGTWNPKCLGKNISNVDDKVGTQWHTWLYMIIVFIFL